METTKSTNEVLTEGTRIAEKWFTDANESVMEVYNKQLNQVTDFYNNLFTSVLGNHQAKAENKGFADMFLNNGFTRGFLFPFNNGINLFSNPFMSSFDAMQSQMQEYNKNLLTTLNQELKRGIVNWSDIRQKYEKTLDGQVETSKKILTAFTEAGNDRMNFYGENYKKLTEEVNHLFNSMIEQNQLIWSDEVKSAPVRFDGEHKKEEAPSQNSIKKKISVLA